MSRCPFAVWRGPIPNMKPGGMVHPVRGLVLHVEEGTEQGTDSWFRNPHAKASAHFGIAASGTLHQWVDTDDRAWAQAAGNAYWWSVETEGDHTTPMTSQQVSTLRALYIWLMTLPDNIPAALAESPDARGLGWHGMGGRSWGGHVNCPGDLRRAQRVDALALIAPPLASPTPPTPALSPITEVACDMATLKTQLVPIPPLNAGGEAWLHIDQAYDEIVDLRMQGSNPDRDHTLYESVDIQAQPDGAGTLVTLRRLTTGHPVSSLFVKWVEG